MQLVEQVKHAIETGALRTGEQLPAIRKVAEDLVINANTVAKAYRELEHAGVIELRQGSGAFVAAGAADGGRLRGAVPLVAEAIGRLRSMGLAEDEIRRLVEAELSALRESAARR
jgi:GntR family transcriptional regulator